MRWFTLLSALLATVSGWAQEIPDGTLLFAEQSCWVVQTRTRSKISHVAMLMNEDGKKIVYEAAPPSIQKFEYSEWVRKYAEFNSRGDKIVIHVRPLAVPLTVNETAKVRESLNANIGRRYSIKGYLMSSSDGIHCAELCGTALKIAGRLPEGNYAKVSPGRLYVVAKQQYPLCSRYYPMLSEPAPIETILASKVRWYGWAADECLFMCW